MQIRFKRLLESSSCGWKRSEHRCLRKPRTCEVKMRPAYIHDRKFIVEMNGSFQIPSFAPLDQVFSFGFSQSIPFSFSHSRIISCSVVLGTIVFPATNNHRQPVAKHVSKIWSGIGLTHFNVCLGALVRITRCQPFCDGASLVSVAIHCAKGIFHQVQCDRANKRSRYC